MSDWIKASEGFRDEQYRLCKELRELRKERDRLKQALEFYADSGNWIPGRQARDGNDDSDVSNDHGKIAWDALNGPAAG